MIPQDGDNQRGEIQDAVRPDAMPQRSTDWRHIAGIVIGLGALLVGLLLVALLFAQSSFPEEEPTLEEQFPEPDGVLLPLGGSDVVLDLRADFAVDDAGDKTPALDGLLDELRADPNVESAVHLPPQTIQGIVPDAPTLETGHRIAIDLSSDASEEAAAEIAAEYEDGNGVLSATVN